MWKKSTARSLDDPEDETFYDVECLTPDELAERINDESFAHTEDYERLIEASDEADPEKEAVFDRFYQQDRSRNQKGHFGLGLPVGKELAKLHKGDLILKDTPGGGCTFLLKIPYGE